MIYGEGQDPLPDGDPGPVLTVIFVLLFLTMGLTFIGWLAQFFRNRR